MTCANQIATLVPYVLLNRTTCLYGYGACATVGTDDLVRLTRESLGDEAGSLDRKRTRVEKALYY